MVLERSRIFPARLLGAALTLLAASCGSGGDGVNAAPIVQADGGAEAGPSVGTMPCTVNTGFPGDNQCIQVPPADKGYQFHYGPSNYADAAEMAKYTLQPNEETTDCVFFKTQNDADLYFNEYHSRLRPGSHHMLLYIQSTQVADGGPGPCNQVLSRNLFGATSPTMDVTNDSNAPENDGMASRIPPHQQVVMQMHVINTGSKPILREGWANIVFTDKANVKTIADPIFFLAGVAMSVQPGQTVTNHGTATVPNNAAPDFRLAVAIPHYHAHTTRFTAYKVTGGVKTPILEQYGTLGVAGDPELVHFDSVTKNNPIDTSKGVPGAYSGDVYLKPGDQIQWECVQTNDGKGINGAPLTTPLQFTEQAYTGEMCNLFGMYAPSLDPTGDGTWKSLVNP